MVLEKFTCVTPTAFMELLFLRKVLLQPNYEHLVAVFKETGIVNGKALLNSLTRLSCYVIPQGIPCVKGNIANYAKCSEFKVLSSKLIIYCNATYFS